MSDSYYELVDENDPQGERFVATDLVRSTWSAAIQHGCTGVGPADPRAGTLRGTR